LTRDEVLTGALHIINEQGVERLTIRRLAESLEVSPMALYRHVANKADLLDGAIDLLIRDARVTEHDEADWRDWLAETFLRMRRALLEHPGALALVMSRTSLGPQALFVMEAVLARLDEHRVERADAARIFQQLMIHTLGSIALLGPILRQAPELADAAERERRIRANFELLPGHGFPHITGHAADLAFAFRETCFVADVRAIAEGVLLEGSR
jgi:TetR/AcrR family tetracycline transcriptional repressor